MTRPSSEPSIGAGRAPRRDALRNRATLILTAQRLIAEEGLTVPFDRIASEAGVGQGTLYRHFPTRADLLAVILLEPVNKQRAVVAAAELNPDPWSAFVTCMTESCRLESEQGGHFEIMTTLFERGSELFRMRVEIQEGFDRIFARAQTSGAIRADASPGDTFLLHLANKAIIERTRGAAPDAWRRNLEIFLAGMRPTTGHPFDSPPLHQRQVIFSVVSEAAVAGKLVRPNK